METIEYRAIDLLADIPQLSRIGPCAERSVWAGMNYARCGLPMPCPRVGHGRCDQCGEPEDSLPHIPHYSGKFEDCETCHEYVERR